MFVTNIGNLKNLNCHTFFQKTLSLSIVYSQCEKTFKEEEPIEILKILVLINNREEYQKIYNHA